MTIFRGTIFKGGSVQIFLTLKLQQPNPILMLHQLFPFHLHPWNPITPRYNFLSLFFHTHPPKTHSWKEQIFLYNKFKFQWILAEDGCWFNMGFKDYIVFFLAKFMFLESSLCLEPQRSILGYFPPTKIQFLCSFFSWFFKWGTVWLLTLCFSFWGAQGFLMNIEQSTLTKENSSLQVLCLIFC